MTTRPRLVVLDLVGTTIHDDGVVPAALRAVLLEAGVDVRDEDIGRLRGASKRDAIAALIPDGPERAQRAAVVHARFMETLMAVAEEGGVRAIDGAEAALEALRAAGIRVALTTGLDRPLAEAILRPTSLRSLANAMICGDEVTVGRPAPFLIFRAMEATGVTSVRDVACVGDTARDLQAGFNAGARWNIGVLSGGQAYDRLAEQPHTHIIDSVMSLPARVGWDTATPPAGSDRSYVPFAPRRILSLPAVTARGFHVKRYAVFPAGLAFDERRFADAQTALITSLPPVDTARGRPGAGVLILHQGATGDYAVLAWWDRENELPTRIWTRHDGAWGPARDDESFCVWDLELLWFERNAWIETVLAGAPVDEGLAEYRRRVESARP